jgi:RNA polymerase sigma factor (sigma-70 family)
MTRTGRVPMEELLAHHEWVTRLAHHLAGTGGSDVAQDAWVAALKTPPQAERPPQPWLAEVLRNLVRRRWRDEERRGRREQAFGAQLPEKVEALDHVYERMELQRILAEEVMALDEQLRTVVVLRYVEDHDSSRIAAMLGCASGTVRWRLKVAVDRLRARLDERCRGDRQAWMAVLVPGAAAPIARTVTKGLLVMAHGKLKTSIVASLVLLLIGSVAGLALWRWRSSPGALTAADQDPERRPRLKPAQLRTSPDSPPPANAGRIAGIVQDEAGRPVSDAIVVAARMPVAGSRAPGPAPVPTRAGADGRFQVPSLAPAGYVLTATKQGIGAGKSDRITVGPSQSVGDVILTLAASAAGLSGTVVDSGRGGIPGAQVLASLVQGNGHVAFGTIADDEGRYDLPLPKGDYGFVARADGYAPAVFAVFLHLPMAHQFRLHPASRISGRVIMRPGGATLGDGEVWARASAGGTARTSIGEDGAYMLSGLPPGSYTLLARSGPYIGRRGTPVAVGLAQEASDVDIAIGPGRVITGDVRDHAGSPVPGAEVTVRSEPPSRAKTDAAGAFRIEGAPAAINDLVATSGQASASRRVDVTRANANGVRLVLSPQARVTGVVVDQSRRPVSGARIVAATGEVRPGPEALGTAFSDERGVFAIDRISAGSLTISAIHDVGNAELAAGPLEPGGHKHVELVLGESGSVSGTVRREDRSPASGALVFAFASAGGYGHTRWPQPTVATLSAEDGTYKLNGIPAGDVILRAVNSGDDPRLSIGRKHRPDHVPTSLWRGEKKTGVDLVVLKNDLEIRGRVANTEGRAVAGATLQALADGAGVPGAQTVSQEDGQFVIDGLTAGPHTISAVHPDHSDGRRDAIAAGSRGIEVQLERPGALAGVVLADGARPASEYMLVGRPVLGSSPAEHELRRAWNSAPLHARVSQADGAFSFARVEPGTYDLTAYLPDKRSATLRAVRVAPGEPKRGLRLVAGPSATIRGRAIDYQTGRPIPGARAEGRGTAYRQLTATADRNGVFTLEGLPVGGIVDFAVIPPRNDYLSDCQHRVVPERGGTIDIGDVPMFPGSNQALGMRAQIATGLWFHSQEGRPAVYSVAPDSPAERAGVRAGDFVVAVNDKDVQQQSSSVAEGLLATGGQSIELTLLSGAGRRTVQVHRADPGAGP